MVYIKSISYNYTTIILPILEPSKIFSLSYDNITITDIALLSCFVTIVIVIYDVISLLLNLAPIKKLEIEK